MQQEKRKELFSPKDVEWLRVTNRKLGEGAFGTVFAGRIKFKDKKPFQVAVKRFHPHAEVEEQELWAYWTVIDNLQREGARLPKMEFVKHEGKTVLVSEVFKKGALTKLVDLLDEQNSLARLKDEEKQKVLDEIAKVTRAGYAFSPDSTTFVKTAKGMLPVLHDIDDMVNQSYMSPETRVAATANLAHFWIGVMYDKNEERLKAFDHVISRLNNPLVIAAFKKMRERTAKNPLPPWKGF